MNDLLNKYMDSNKSDFILAGHNPQDNEMELWNSFRSGNRHSLNTIFERYVRVLFAYGRNMTEDRELISDCIQDIFVELWIKRDKVTAQVNSIKYYLIKSVRRRILRRLFSDRRFLGQAIPEDYCEMVDFNIEYNLIQAQTSRELSLQLKTSIATLSKAQQEAIYLKFYENMTYDEVASVMNKNVKAVYNLIGKSIITLRSYFKANPISGG